MALSMKINESCSQEEMTPGSKARALLQSDQSQCLMCFSRASLEVPGVNAGLAVLCGAPT